MIQHRFRRATLLVLLGGSCVVASCAGPGPSTDPGNRLLRAMAADPVFAQPPPGATRASVREKPAKWRSSWFGGGGWDGPAVTLTFTSDRSVREVYGFYARRAAEAGWTPYQTLSEGFTRTWEKRTARTISDLSLLPNFDIHSVSVTASGTPRSYTLNASGTRLPGNSSQRNG